MLWDTGNEDVEISSEMTGSGSGNSISGCSDPGSFCLLNSRPSMPKSKFYF